MNLTTLPQADQQSKSLQPASVDGDQTQSLCGPPLVKRRSVSFVKREAERGGVGIKSERKRVVIETEPNLLRVGSDLVNREDETNGPKKGRLCSSMFKLQRAVTVDGET